MALNVKVLWALVVLSDLPNRNLFTFRFSSTFGNLQAEPPPEPGPKGPVKECPGVSGLPRLRLQLFSFKEMIAFAM